MKKKILLIILMFLFITNVKALSFNVGVQNIEEVGTDSLGSVTKIDIPDREVDVLFEEIGAEASFTLTIKNTGDRAGTLREITITPENDKIEYTTNLPEGGLAINGDDTNQVTVTAKVKEGAVNGKSSTELKIKYTYDEGSCPDGEILSEDESMCLCPEGLERNEKGVCVKPEKETIECKDDEIYNETKKICEKKVVPVPDKVVPSNPKTLDNIILVTLLFIVSGLGIYAVMFKKLKTDKKRITAGVITGVVTLSLSFTVLAGVFGLDNLLSAIVNPITKNKELTVTVYEEIDLIETWDGDCDITDASELIPSNIFDGGSGTQADPYRVKTANQLACFAKSVNNGTTYEGKFIKQTKTIKLNDNLNAQVEANDLSNAHLWTSAGISVSWQMTDDTRYFAGTYNGNNKAISGLYITNDSSLSTSGNYNFRGMFAVTRNATFKNMILSDVYMNTDGDTGTLVGYAFDDLKLDNITTYGKGVFTDPREGYYAYDGSGVISNYQGNDTGSLIIENTTNNMHLSCDGSCSGIVHRINSIGNSEDYNLILRNVVNNGNITFTKAPSGAGGIIGYDYQSNPMILVENCANTGNFTFEDDAQGGGGVAGLFGYLGGKKITIKDTYNTGNITNIITIGYVGGMISSAMYFKEFTMDNCWNSGNIISPLTIAEAKELGWDNSYASGLVGGGSTSDEYKYTVTLKITDCYNTGKIYIPRHSYVAGIFGKYEDAASVDGIEMKNCYNTGAMTGYHSVAGLVGYFGGSIRESYNTGSLTAVGPGYGWASGLVGYGSSNIYNSYNTGNINIKADGVISGGLCMQSCTIIENSYNTGNITLEDSDEYIGGDVAGILGLADYDSRVVNSYNSGNITVKSSSGLMIGGISCNGGKIINSYNLGNITLEAGMHGGYVGGIGVGGVIQNSVNKGNITLKGTATEGVIGGITGYSSGLIKNNWNAGTISTTNAVIDDSNNILVGEVSSDYYSGATLIGNKWNTNPNGKALGCTETTSWKACTVEQSEAAGSYTTETEPDILSVINGTISDEEMCTIVERDFSGYSCTFNTTNNTCEYSDPADIERTARYKYGYKCGQIKPPVSGEFEIKEGATLPTLKVFNE